MLHARGARLSAPLSNAIVAADGTRIVTWTSHGPGVVSADTGEVELELVATGRILALARRGPLACLSQPRSDRVDVALWDLVRGERVASIELPPHVFGITIDHDLTVTYVERRAPHARSRRRRYDLRGEVISDEAFTRATTCALPVVWTVAADVVLHATPLAEIVLLPHVESAEILVAAPVAAAPPTWRSVHATHGGPNDAHVAIHVAEHARTRVVDVARRTLVEGPWSAPGARAGFLCGEHVVVATDTTLVTHDLEGRELSARAIDAVTYVTPMDERCVALASSGTITVVDVARDRALDVIQTPTITALFGGSGRLVAAHEGGAFTIVDGRDHA